ncbi:MAG: hypothetical protein IJN96_06580 [Clostridia bacterium]|nr:hypothetical protein [Clostridia bacterium]
MKKRMLAAIISLIMIIATVSGVSFAETATTGGNIVTTGSLTDELADFSNVYSITNIRQVTDNALLTCEGYNDNTIWQLEHGAKAAEIVYKFEKDIELASVYFEFSRDGIMKYPVISWSENGVTYTDLTTRMDVQRGEDEVVLADWTRIFSSSEANLWQFGYATTKSIPANARYIKIEMQEGSLATDRTFFKKIVFSGIKHSEISESITDEFESFDNLYSVSNIGVVSGSTIMSDSSLWTVTDKTKAAEFVYKTADNSFFTAVSLEISRNNPMIYPIISYSVDGRSFTDITKRFDVVKGEDAETLADWTRIFNANDASSWQWGYSTSKNLPVEAKYIKVEIPANASTSAYYLRKAALTVMKHNVLSGSVNDTCEDFSNVYNSTNLQIAPASAVNEFAAKDTTAWQMINGANAAEVVYKVEDNVELSGIHVEIVRWDPIIFPVISYSEDGLTYTNLNTPMTSASLVGAGWEYIDSATADGRNLYRERYKFDGSFPAGTKYVKISVQAGSVANNDIRKLFFNEIDLTAIVRNVVSENGTDSFADFSKTYSVTNIAQVENTIESDSTLWTVADKTKAAEIVYKAADGLAFSQVSFDFSRNAAMKHPVITYSSDGENFKDLTFRNTSVKTEDDEVLADWTRKFNAGDGNQWQWGYATTKSVPKGTKYIKIEIMDNASDKAFYFREASFVLAAQPEMSLSVDFNGTAVVNIEKAGTGTAKLIVAEYDMDDRLVAVVLKDVDLSKTGVTDKNLPASANGWYYKAFLFEDMSSFVPMLECASNL